jgi:hypothetical protein
VIRRETGERNMNRKFSKRLSKEEEEEAYYEAFPPTTHDDFELLDKAYNEFMPLAREYTSLYLTAYDNTENRMIKLSFCHGKVKKMSIEKIDERME